MSNHFQEGGTLRYLRPILVCAVFCSWLTVTAALASEENVAGTNADEQAIRQQSLRMVEAYNSGQAKAVAAAFLPEGEAIDEAGNVYQGREQFEQIFGKFFEQFPGVKMTLDAATVRLLGSGLAVEDGTRKVVTKDGTGKAATKYTLTYAKRDGQWLIASARDFTADEEPTPHERLVPLAWLVGDWVDENAESVVLMSCRWSEDENFLMMEYTAKIQGRSAMKTSQRIGWDPLHQASARGRLIPTAATATRTGRRLTPAGFSNPRRCCRMAGPDPRRCSSSPWTRTSSSCGALTASSATRPTTITK